jgi:hypothetical protein
MPLIPYRFLFRTAHPCLHLADIPREEGDELLDLPESCRLDDFGAMDERPHFADVRLAWNERGLALQVEVRGKDKEAVGDAARPRQSDGVTLWLDTRESRTSHRASRYCHMFHFLAAGGGAEKDEAVCLQGKINRALEDAPSAAASEIPFRRERRRIGYLLEAFLPAAALNGFDPEQSPRLGFYYAVRDNELGEQTAGLDGEFPWAEDPTLWNVLELVRREAQKTRPRA